MIQCPLTASVCELREACDYLLIPFNAETVKCSNLRGLLHELSNDGAHEQFSVFLEDLILPLMVNSAKVRSCVHTGVHLHYHGCVIFSVNILMSKRNNYYG